MKKLLSGFAAIAIAIASFAMVQAKYSNAAIDCSEIGGTGAVWFVYNGVLPATTASIVNPANYVAATALQVAACSSTSAVCAICALPQESNTNRPELSQELAPDTRAGLLNYVNFEQSQTGSLPSEAFIIEKP